MKEICVDEIEKVEEQMDVVIGQWARGELSYKEAEKLMKPLRDSDAGQAGLDGFIRRVRAG